MQTQSYSIRNLIPYVLAMCVIVAAANYLVQFPVYVTLGTLQPG